MNLRPKLPDDMDINLTPLIDVVFLLLIFFMVSTTFKDDARLRINLPEADGQAVSADEPTMLEIVNRSSIVMALTADPVNSRAL